MSSLKILPLFRLFSKRNVCQDAALYAASTLPTENIYPLYQSGKTLFHFEKFLFLHGSGKSCLLLTCQTHGLENIKKSSQVFK